MNSVVYARFSHEPPMTRKESAELIRKQVEEKSLQVINTRSSSLDARLLRLLINNQPKKQQAVVAFRE